MDQQLQVFVTVAELKNFSRAAEKLHMTQPAVSQYIRSLEITMGSKLLERSNKFVRLNQAGEMVYYHAKEILGLYTKMHDLMDDLINQASGSISIGASYTFGEYVLPHVIKRVHQHYPLIQPTITIGNTFKIANLVLSHQIDVGIVEGAFHDKHLVIEPFAEDLMYIVAAPNHGLARKSISELEKETWIVREQGSGTREVTEKMFQSIGIAPKEKLEFGSTQIIKESIAAGLGISLLSYWAIREESARGSLSVMDVNLLPIKREFSIVLRSPFQTKALNVFLSLLREFRSKSPQEFE
ncbi:LysR family transcriptional regulator [Gracilibacillus caseinilyticus]|uniref:LysR family transcriptional regulator n=1 Tax=Gracilibacillus caseinilyticus TaxID=2932256 RepID=A0ABY4F2H6_9BACI|nr:LysR family transcriptional regulator [Gracilibacillus caseinilyticus]UOQ50420.1 LysR family transcriptional regulator [Gracilibacillus caseinilyticus]